MQKGSHRIYKGYCSKSQSRQTNAQKLCTLAKQTKFSPPRVASSGCKAPQPGASDGNGAAKQSKPGATSVERPCSGPAASFGHNAKRGPFQIPHIEWSSFSVCKVMKMFHHQRMLWQGTAHADTSRIALGPSRDRNANAMPGKAAAGWIG